MKQETETKFQDAHVVLAGLSTLLHGRLEGSEPLSDMDLVNIGGR